MSIHFVEVEEALRAERVNARSLAEEHEKLRKQLHKKKRNVAVGNFDVWNDPVTKLEEKLRNSRKEAENLRDQLERMKHQQEVWLCFSKPLKNTGLRFIQ